MTANYVDWIVSSVCNLCKLCLVIMCYEQQTCPDGRHRLVSLEKSLTSARCLLQGLSCYFCSLGHSSSLDLKSGELHVGC